MNFFKEHKKDLRWFVLFFLLGFVIGLPFNGVILLHTLTGQTSAEEWRKGPEGYINPLLGLSYPDDAVFQELKPLQYDLETLAQSEIQNNKADRVSIYFRDQTSGHSMEVNGNETFAPASLIKIPMMITYFKVAEDQPDILNKQLQYTGPDQNTQEYFKPDEHLVPGQYYTVSDLIQRMIVNSDNNALLMLFNNMDKKTLGTIFSDLSISVPQDLNQNGDFITPANFSRFFRILYNATYLDEDYSQKALALMDEAEFKEGLAAGVPAGAHVSDKFGETPDVDQNGKHVGYELHDCGIIYAPNHPYILCVMTSGQSYDTLAGVIKDVSSMVYSTFKTVYK